MKYFDDNKKVKFSDLESSGRYSTTLIEEMKKGNYHEIKKILDIDSRKDKDFMEPLMYAVKNEKGTYAIYQYYHEKIQNDRILATEIVRKEPELIENTPFSKQKEFILQVAEINPRVIEHMSHDLKEDSQFTVELCDLQIEQITKYAAIECKMPEVFIENPELTENEIFMKQAISQDVHSLDYVPEELKNNFNFMKDISKNTEVIDYIVEHTEQFGKQGLKATKESLVEISTNEAISGFAEESEKIKNQIKERQNEDKDESLEQLIKRDKQLERHIKFFERIQKGEVDPVRAARLMDKLCKNMEPEYKRKINQLIGLDNAIVLLKDEDEKNKSKKMLESAIEATEDSVRTEQIDKEEKKIIEIQKNKDKPKEVEENTL